MAIFWHVRPNLGKIRIVLKKRLCYLCTLIVPQLHAKFREILGAVSEINCVTNGRTDKGEIIEPVASLVQYEVKQIWLITWNWLAILSLYPLSKRMKVDIQRPDLYLNMGISNDRTNSKLLPFLSSSIRVPTPTSFSLWNKKS